MKKKKRTPPSVGSKYRHVFRGELYEMVVVESPEGIGYEVRGEVFRSPTAAAKAVVGKDQHTNGWNFWNMDSKKKS